MFVCLLVCLLNLSQHPNRAPSLRHGSSQSGRDQMCCSIIECLCPLLCAAFARWLVVCSPLFITKMLLIYSSEKWQAWNPLELPTELASELDSEWFVLYRQDLELCVNFNEQITLNSCMWPDLWRFANGSLEHQNTGLCLTYDRSNTNDSLCHAITWESDERLCVVLTLAGCPCDHRRDVNYPDWAQRWHADSGRIIMQASLNETDVNTTSMVDETQKKHLFMWISGNLALLVPL